MNSLLNFTAELTKGQMRTAESVAQSHDINRRIVFAALTRSEAELCASFKANIDSLRDVIFRVGAYREHLENMLEVASVVEARLADVEALVQNRYACRNRTKAAPRQFRVVARLIPDPS